MSTTTTTTTTTTTMTTTTTTTTQTCRTQPIGSWATSSMSSGFLCLPDFISSCKGLRNTTCIVASQHSGHNNCAQLISLQIQKISSGYVGLTLFMNYDYQIGIILKMCMHYFITKEHFPRQLVKTTAAAKLQTCIPGLTTIHVRKENCLVNVMFANQDIDCYLSYYLEQPKPDRIRNRHTTKHKGKCR